MKRDKILHFAACLLIALVMDMKFHPVIAFLLTMVVGIAKEEFDERIKGTFFDWKDIAADAAGGAAFLILVLSLRYGVGLDLPFSWGV